MVLELGLARGHRFEPPLHNLHVCFPHLFLFSPLQLFDISPPNLQLYGTLHIAILWYLSPEFAILWHSPHASMRSYVREDVKEHDMHIKPKYCMLKFLEKLVIQHN